MYNLPGVYNLLKKTFPDGTIQYMRCTMNKKYDFTVETDEIEHDGSAVERKERDNASRAVQKVFDIARSNHWDYFCTWTFAPGAVGDRYNYDDCVDALKHWLDYQRKKGVKWLIVAEQHEDGAYHFHGLLSGPLNLAFLYGDQYRIIDFPYGRSSASPVRSQGRVSSYVAKYLTKKITVPKGRKRYWASRNLCKPTVEHLVCSDLEFGSIFNDAAYSKMIPTPYGDYLFCEVRREEVEGK